MKKYLISFIYLLAVFCGGTAYGQRWYSNIDKALAIAKEENKLVLVDFNADWCPYCRDMELRIISRSPFRSLAKNDLILVRLDCPNDGTMSRYVDSQSQRLRVTGYPTLFLINPKNREILDRLGYMTERPFLARVRAAIESIE